MAQSQIRQSLDAASKSENRQEKIARLREALGPDATGMCMSIPTGCTTEEEINREYTPERMEVLDRKIRAEFSSRGVALPTAQDAAAAKAEEQFQQAAIDLGVEIGVLRKAASDAPEEPYYMDADAAYGCELCNKAFPTTRSLTGHLSAVHKVSKDEKATYLDSALMKIAGSANLLDISRAVRAHRMRWKRKR